MENPGPLPDDGVGGAGLHLQLREGIKGCNLAGQWWRCDTLEDSRNYMELHQLTSLDIIEFHVTLFSIIQHYLPSFKVKLIGFSSVFKSFFSPIPTIFSADFMPQGKTQPKCPINHGKIMGKNGKFIGQ